MPKGAQRTNTNEDDDEQYRDPENKWEGFHFTRLTCISILTFIIMIVALILDNLSVWGTERPCENLETQSVCVGCPRCNEIGVKCTGQGQCGWRTGVTKWVSPNAVNEANSALNVGYCPACSMSGTCIEGDDNSWTSEFNYAELCRDNEDDEACMAMDGVYCRDRSIFPCDICNEKTHLFLGCLYGCTLFCNFIPVAVWFFAADGGMCDNADPNYQTVFPAEDTINFPGYSTGGLMICIIANMVGCGAVCCCWGDNRHYGDERDQAKIDRQREKEMYKQQQQTEMQQQNAGQPQNMTYSYN